MRIELSPRPDRVTPLVHQDLVLEATLGRDVAPLDREHKFRPRLEERARRQDFDIDGYPLAGNDGQRLVM